jgi:hypothetical protein
VLNSETSLNGGTSTSREGIAANAAQTNNSVSDDESLVQTGAKFSQPELEELSGFPHQKISRFRQRLDDEEAYQALLRGKLSPMLRIAQQTVVSPVLSQGDGRARQGDGDVQI